jgi:hypothetical protein
MVNKNGSLDPHLGVRASESALAYPYNNVYVHVSLLAVAHAVI